MPTMAKSKQITKTRSPTEFTVFKKLPQEMRDIIWGLAAPGANTIQIKGTPFYTGKKDGLGNLIYGHVLSASYKVPVLFRVSRESREAAKKIYIKLFRSEKEFANHPVYFRPSLDTLYIVDSSTFKYICSLSGFKVKDPPGASLPSFNGPILNSLRCLQLGQDFGFIQKPYMKKILDAFGNPKLVVLTKPKDCRRLSDWTFRELQLEVERDWGVGEEESEKYKPELLVLTEFQLAKKLVSL